MKMRSTFGKEMKSYIEENCTSHFDEYSCYEAVANYLRVNTVIKNVMALEPTRSKSALIVYFRV